MSTNTTNYNLVKPDMAEKIDLNVINANYDILDSELYAMQQDINSRAVTTALQTHIDDSNVHLTATLKAYVVGNYFYKLASWDFSIAENDDLNAKTELGVYKAVGASLAATLTNCPVSIGFKLNVELIQASIYIKQTIFTQDSKVYFRVGNKSTSVFTDWERVITSTEFSALEARVAALENDN